MQEVLLWSGIEYQSLEHCNLTVARPGIEVNATILGVSNNQIFKVDYSIRTNNSWQTIFCQVQMKTGNQLAVFRMGSDGNGNWTLNNELATQFAGCIDVDIIFTPFTNSLPINRLALRIGESAQIQVVYFDLATFELRPATQRYTRLADRKYKFENVPNDFEADLEVDELGMVISYPGLFARKATDKLQ